MIKQPDPLTTTVQFGKDGVGSVGLTVCIATRGLFIENCKLTIQQLIPERGEIRIGQPFDPKKDITELPKVELNFTDPASVDAMIDCLQKLKEKMEHPFPAYCYCA